MYVNSSVKLFRKNNHHHVDQEQVQVRLRVVILCSHHCGKQM